MCVNKDLEQRVTLRPAVIESVKGRTRDDNFDAINIQSNEIGRSKADM